MRLAFTAAWRVLNFTRLAVRASQYDDRVDERQQMLDMRCSLLDIEMTPDRRTPQAAAVVRMDIEPGNRLSR